MLVKWWKREFGERGNGGYIGHRIESDTIDYFLRKILQISLCYF